MRNLFDPDAEVFNETKRLNKKPKIIIFTILIFMFSLVIYVIFSSGVTKNLKNATDLEVLKQDSGYNNDDDFVKNLAGNQNNTPDIPDDDFRKSLEQDKDTIYKREQPVEPVLSDNNSVIFEDTLKSVFIPISELEDENIIMDRTDSLSSVHLTASEITTFRQKRLANLDEALRSRTSIEHNSLSKSSTEAKAGSKDVSDYPTYLEQVKEVMALSGIEPKEAQNSSPVAETTNVWSLDKRLEKSSPLVIKTGSIIPATLITSINSSVAGEITGQVRQNVYDTSTGKNLLIPQGTRLVGNYASEVPYGKERLFISWNRMVFPDGTSLDLEGMPGVDMAGRAGFKDKVDNHYDKIFGNALLLSIIVAGVTLSQKNLLNDLVPFFMEDATSSLSESLGQNLGETMSQMIRKNLNIAPEIKIKSGYLFNIMIIKDITLPVYKGNN